MAEKEQRQRLIQLLKPLHAISVENLVGAGTPDINYGGVHEGTLVAGWIECKWLREWPTRGGPLRVPHYTNQQKVWAHKRRFRGGACWLVLQVCADWVLLDGAVAAENLGKRNREELIELAAHYWDSTPTREELICSLKQNCPPTS